MPDVTTSLLQLVLQTTGGNDNTWGDIANTNFQRLEYAIAGATTVTTSSGTVTLTDDQALRGIINVVSGLTGDLTVVVPTHTRTYLVLNNSSGAYALTVKTAAGTGVNVAQGSKELLCCDGTNVVTTKPSAADPGPPTGSVHWMATTTVPTGYLECNGQAVSRTTYANLFAVIGVTWGPGDSVSTFNLPDLRGEFVRGWDHGKGTDSGRAFASAQSGQVESHTHDAGTLATSSVADHSHTLPSTGASAGIGSGSQKLVYGAGSDNGVTTLPAGGHSHTMTGATASYGTGAETRPRNVALMPVIRI